MKIINQNVFTNDETCHDTFVMLSILNSVWYPVYQWLANMHEEVVIDINIYIICTAFPKIYYKNVLVRCEKTKESKIKVTVPKQERYIF